MKVLLCCILKLENRYLDEWINYYRKLGVDKIVIYDNNDIEGPYAEDIRKVKSVAKGIDSNFIDVYSIPAPQPYCIQNKVYDDCYTKYGNDYDWIMRFDIDEFLVLEKFDNVHDFLSQKKFDNFDIIHLNWKIFDDNNIIKSPKKYSVFNTYTRELSDTIPNRFYFNNEMKSIIRGGLKLARCRNAHTLIDKVKSCNAIGIEDNSLSFVSSFPLHKGAWLNHYITKSIDEYFNIKMMRQATGNGNVCDPERIDIAFYFMYNEFTAEKFKYIKNIMPSIEQETLNQGIANKINEHIKLLKKEQNDYCKDFITKEAESEPIFKKVLSFKNPNQKPEQEVFDYNKLVFK